MNAPATQSVGVIRGERYCTSCSFPLVGQPVTRDATYNLLIARCPECGTAAALQEYPTLNRWATRLAALVAVVYMLVVLALVAVSAYAVRFWAVDTQRALAEGYSEHLAAAHQTRVTSENLLATLTPPPSMPKDQFENNLKWMLFATPGYTCQVDTKWFESTGRSLMASETSRWRPAAIRDMLYSIASGFIVAVAVGVLWAAILWHIPRRRAWFIAIIATAPGLAWAIVLPGISVVAWALWYAIGARGVPNTSAWIGLDENTAWAARVGLVTYKPAGLIAWGELFWQSWTYAAIALYVGCLLGLLFGRPIARLTLRLLVPPRLLTPIADFWAADGLKPPRQMGY